MSSASPSSTTIEQRAVIPLFSIQEHGANGHSQTFESASPSFATIEQRAVIRFLVHKCGANGHSPKFEKCVSWVTNHVSKWVREFCDGWTNIFDEEWVGKPKDVSTPQLVCTRIRGWMDGWALYHVGWHYDRDVKMYSFPTFDNFSQHFLSYNNNNNKRQKNFCHIV